MHTEAVARRLSRALFRKYGEPSWLAFEDPHSQFQAHGLEDVRPVLERAEAAARAGSWVVGMITYDAGPAFDPAIVALRDNTVPLATFAVFSSPCLCDGPRDSAFDTGPWSASRTQVEHARDVAQIREHIAAGTVYQVNYTMRLTADFHGDPEALFAGLQRAQPAEHVAFIDFESAAVCSASPELFLRRTGQHIETRPMKGTRPRNQDPRRDRTLADELRRSAKDLAENTMIVDMARNDLGRVAEIGTVTAPHLHTVESYPTVHQLTSTVHAQSQASFADLISATFPAASITGAPKVSACRIIAELEGQPRGAYTGSIGVLAPGGDFTMNVAIRTAWIDRERETVTYGVGGGIVWDSRELSEWREAHDKARILRRAAPPFRLLETILWVPGFGATLLERHLARLSASAQHFGFDLSIDEVRRTIDNFSAKAPQRLRLLVDPRGTLELQGYDLEPPRPRGPVEIPIDSQPIDPDDDFLRHKTTRREVYEQARARFPDESDVVLWNTNRELTEATTANIVVQIDGRLLTPPADAGLLPGTLRAELLAQGLVQEQPIPLALVSHIRSAWLINSVRGWTAIKLREPTPPPSL